MLRDPECSINQTKFSVSRQTSMKWLPPPSVPNCFIAFALRSSTPSCRSLKSFQPSQYEDSSTDSLYALKPTGIASSIARRKSFNLPSRIPLLNGVLTAIGCGMMAVKTPFKSGILDGKLKDLRLAIEEAIPVGFNAYKESVDESSYWDGWKDFSDLHEGVLDRKAKAMKQLGTLGGGNHFIEVCLDTENFVWLMLHSGSRNIGKELAERHISTAKSLWRLSELPAPDLAYFIQGTPEFAAYWKDLKWAQTYAMKNREIMMARLLKVFNKMFNHRKAFRPELAVNCHHNYVALEEHYGENVFITRKGAINAAAGVYGIIPGSMGAK